MNLFQRTCMVVWCIIFMLCGSSLSYAVCSGAGCTTNEECNSIGCAACPSAGGIEGQVTCRCWFEGLVNPNTMQGYAQCTDIIHGITGEVTKCGGCGFTTYIDPCRESGDPCCGNPDPCCGNPNCCPN